MLFFASFSNVFWQNASRSPIVIRGANNVDDIAGLQEKFKHLFI